MAPKFREDDHWGVGQQADGSIDVMTEEEARAAIARRDAEDEAWSGMMDGEDLDDISDLNDEI